MTREFLLAAACLLVLVQVTRAQDAPTAPAGALDEELVTGGFSAEDLLDRSVKTAAGDDVGDVEDLLLSGDYSVKAVVVDLGGFLGIGKRNVAIPIKRLQTNTENEFIVDMSEDDIEALPSLEKDDAVWVSD